MWVCDVVGDYGIGVIFVVVVVGCMVVVVGGKREVV